jgi:serine/threonine protein phosphatase PrpC
MALQLHRQSKPKLHKAKRLPRQLQKSVNPLCFTIWSDKIPNYGEDAPPIHHAKHTHGFIAVLDGMGGAGNEKYTAPDGVERSGAYIGARAAREYLDLWQMRHTKGSINGYELAAGFNTALQATYDTLVSRPSLIKSKMRRTLPTTLAAVRYSITSKQTKIESLWAGDSRAYVLTTDGLRQLSKDDADVDESSLSGFMQDAPLTNCISLNGETVIHTHTQCVDGPCVLIVATDGCYGYLSSPAHVEQLLLACMHEAKSATQWGELVHARLLPVAGDDFSMALVCIGWKKHADVISAFSQRLKYIANLVKRFDDLNAAGTPESAAECESLFQDYYRSYRFQ